MQKQMCDVLVVGDEVESILTAVSAARAGARVALARRSAGRLGGLSVRGGLSYMDITPEFVTGLFQEFLERAGVVRVALNPDRAESVLAELLSKAGVQVFSGVEADVAFNGEGFPDPVRLTDAKGNTITLAPRVVLDATPDADLARAVGLPYISGMGDLFDPRDNFLGVSPVFRIAGVSVAALREFEAALRDRPDLPDRLARALPLHPPDLRAALLTRPTYAPDDMDYLDILNPVIGIDYHCWRHKGTRGSTQNEGAESYARAGIAIDGANISRLSDGTLGFNGMVASVGAMGWDLSDLLAFSHGGPTPEPLQREMQAFQQYLREVGGFRDVVVIPPEELYVRQTVTMRAQGHMTARRAIAGGVSAAHAIGRFSYWLDLRGIVLWRYFPGVQPPKPTFNIGLDVCLPSHPAFRNFAFVGRSAGYSPIGQGAGRIVQHNALLGEALGVAAALSAQGGPPLDRLIRDEIHAVRQVLQDRGCALPDDSKAADNPACEAEIRVEDGLRALLDLDEAFHRGLSRPLQPPTMGLRPLDP